MSIYDRLRAAEPNFVGKQYFRSIEGETALTTAIRFERSYPTTVLSIGEFAAWKHIQAIDTTGFSDVEFLEWKYASKKKVGVSTFITAGRIKPEVALLEECEPRQATIELLYVSDSYFSKVKLDDQGIVSKRYVAWFLSKRRAVKYNSQIRQLLA